jgi:imidazolonepropionase-like amidohydrolase
MLKSKTVFTCLAGIVLLGLYQDAAHHLRAQGAGAPAATATVAFTNVNVVPMDKNRVLGDHTVIVTKDRITAVGPAGKTKVPEGATRVDGKGKFLMPGLAEMHGHIPPLTPQPPLTKAYVDDVLYLYVAAGITTVRGMQGTPGQLELREASKRGEIIAPALYLAGPPFNAKAVTTPDEAAAFVRKQKAEGWDLIKVMPGPSIENYDGMAKTAKEIGLPFAGHVPPLVGLPHVLEMGQSTIDHLDLYAEHLGGLNKPVDDAAVKDIVARTKKAGTVMVPTLYVWETLRGPIPVASRTGLPELKYMPKQIVAGWTKGLETRLSQPQYNAEEAKIYIDNRMKIMTALYKAGVRILLGSDAPQQFNVPGFSIEHEMKRMADAGMTTFDILASGTSLVGEYYKAHDDFGTVAAGKRADLVLLDANPLEGLSNVAKRSGVMIRGRWLPASEIQKKLDEIATRNATATP